jgi:hypothetical protein
MNHLRYRRMRLRRSDGRVYLDRWGVIVDRVGGVYLHRMTAPDPGRDLHDHPWTFWSVILRGGYTEQVTGIDGACSRAWLAKSGVGRPGTSQPGDSRTWRPGSVHRIKLDQCHRIIELRANPCWTLVIRGPRRRNWGFYTPQRWVCWHDYHAELDYAENRGVVR